MHTRTHTHIVMSKALKWIVIALVVWVYARYAFKVRPGLDILETSITNDRMHEVLAEKYPIIIAESIPDIKDVMRTTFKHQYITSRAKSIPLGGGRVKSMPSWRRCIARYTLLHVHHHQGASVNIDVKHPNMKFDVVRISMRDSGLLILPPRYMYRPVADSTDELKKAQPSPRVVTIELFDALHVIAMPLLFMTR